MAIEGTSDSEEPKDGPDASQEHAPDLGAPMPGEDPTANPLSNSMSSAARSFESRFAARRKKRLEETAAALGENPGAANYAAASHEAASSEGASNEAASHEAANIEAVSRPEAGAEPASMGEELRYSIGAQQSSEAQHESTQQHSGDEPRTGGEYHTSEEHHTSGDDHSPSAYNAPDGQQDGPTIDYFGNPQGDEPAHETPFVDEYAALANQYAPTYAHGESSGHDSQNSSSGMDQEIGPSGAIDDNAKRFLEKLSGKYPDAGDQGVQHESVIHRINQEPAGDQPAYQYADQSEPASDSPSYQFGVDSNTGNEPAVPSPAFDPGELDQIGWKKVSDSHKVADAGSAAASQANTTGSTGVDPAAAGFAAGLAAGAAAGAISKPGIGKAGQDFRSAMRSRLQEANRDLAETGRIPSIGRNQVRPDDMTARPEPPTPAAPAAQAPSPPAAQAQSPSPPSPAAPSDIPPPDQTASRGGFKPRKDLSSYRNFDSSKAGSSSALSGPGGSADAKLFGGMASAPEDLPEGEPQTAEDRKKALDAIGYKRGTELPSEYSGGLAPSAPKPGNDQFKPPTPAAPSSQAAAAASSDVGWQSVPKDETRPKLSGFAAARRSQTLNAMELAAKKKEETLAPPAEKAKPFRGREDDSHIPKNRWGQAPDTATARSVWADQLGIPKPATTMRGPSASLRGRLKRVMSSDIFNVRELYSLRGIAAFIVFLAQAQIFAAHGKPAYPVHVVGAQIFFVMSGFVITRWLLVNETGSIQRTLGEFYARRALRIFPMYYLVLCVLMFTGHLPNAESFFCGLFNFSAAQSAKIPAQLVQYWTLCVEMQFYVLFPLLLMITPQRFRMALVILLTGGTVAATYMSAQATPHAQDWLLLPISGQYIMWGCLAGYMDVKSDIALSLNASMCVVLGIASQIALHVWILMYGNIPSADVADALWKGLSTINALSLSILIFGLWRTNNAWLRGICANDIMVYFGKISYGFYILLPLCFFMQPSIIAVMPILAKVPAIVTSFVITFVMAVVTFHYLQSPINSVREHLPIAR